MALPKPDIKREYNTIDYERLKSLPLGDEIINFCSVILKNFDDSYLDNFYNNINSINVIINQYDNNHKNCYDGINNTIYLESEEDKNFIYHELFHMASTTYKDDIIYCGFAQNNVFFTEGRGISEGYTELLTKKYFRKDNDDKEVYYEEVLFTKFIESIVGEDKMTQLFFTSNLEGLITELSKYQKLERVTDFIDNLDLFTANRYHNLSFEDKDEVETFLELHKEIREFLLNTYINKVAKEINNSNKSKEEKEKDIELLVEYIYDIVDTSIILNTETKEEIEVLSFDYIEDSISRGLGIEKIKLFEK